MRRARDAIAREIEDTHKTAKGNAVFATVSDDKNWPSDCQTLFEAIEVGYLTSNSLVKCPLAD